MNFLFSALAAHLPQLKTIGLIPALVRVLRPACTPPRKTRRFIRAALIHPIEMPIAARRNHVEKFAKYCIPDVHYKFVLWRDSGASAIGEFGIY
jgi:hypothetical protein